MKLLLILLLLPVFSQAQTLVNGHAFPQQQVNEALQKGWEEKDYAPPITGAPEKTTAASPSGIYHLLQQEWQGQTAASKLHPTSTLKSQGILYVGTTPHDTLVVTGTWQNNSSLFVINDGVVIFNNARATIAGDLLVGGTGKIIAVNSTLYFPQQYFYEWGLVAVQHGLMQMRHCTINFAGLAHMIGMADSATIHLQNMYFTDDNTTTGLNGASSFIVDSANLLGEIVATDSIHLNLNHVDTVIIWHRVQRGQSLTWTFPNGINLQHYAIGPDSLGVSGMRYTVEADNIKLLNWAIMPDNNSTVNISNSAIRSVGAIFRGTDNATVQGLVDNSTYTSSSNLFTDRTFQLNNCTVETFGLYPTDTTNINITGCITGEIGTGGHAHTNCSSSFSDGTGGYFWANGMGVATVWGCGLKCPVRAEQQGFVVCAFNSIAAATGLAIDSAVLIMVQTPTISPPVAYDGSDVWVGMLTPQTVNAGDTVLLTGSAYILRGPTSHLMSFASYYVAWAMPGTSNYTIIGSASTTPVNTNTLANWTTNGLAPGNYPLILVIKDDYGDSVTVNSAITLQPAGTGIPNIQNSDWKVFPNPATNQLTITGNQPTLSKVTLLNVLGQTVFDYNCVEDAKTSLNIDIHQVPSGVYIYRIITENDKVVEGKVVKM